jgi:diphthine-ammonia ligase
MYQTVGHDAVHLIAEAMGLPLYRTTIHGKALNQGASYGDRLPGQSSTVKLDDEKSGGYDETEDLHQLLLQVKEAHPEVNAVSVGAILSNYQRVRVEHVALRPDVQMLPLSFLWQRDQAQLLDEMCEAGMHSILIKVAGAGLEEGDLGKTLEQMRGKLHHLNKLYGAHICGEGGEYETLTLDCPLFKSRIVLDRTKTMMHGQNSSDGVYYMTVGEAHLEAKERYGQLDSVAVPPMLDKQSEATFDDGGEARQSQSNNGISIESQKSLGPSFAAFSHTIDAGGNAARALKTLFVRLQDDLSLHGLSLAHLSHLNIYLGSQQDFSALNALYRDLFGVDPPSRACIALESTEEGTSIALDAIAQSRIDHVNRKVLHVQGRSHWAAANIGPYSQAVESQGHITIAGQIGLAPQTLTLIEDERRQIVLALQHARRVLKATLEEHRVGKRQGWVESCICWINEARWLPFVRDTWTRQGATSRDDGEADPGWDQHWLGTDLSAEDVPVVYVQLSPDGLPRGAAAEWQLTAHSGDHHVVNDGQHEDDDETDLSPIVTHGKMCFIGYDCNWRALSAGSPAVSSFGIACLTRQGQQEEGGAETQSSANLTQVLSSALLVRVVYRTGIDVSTLRQLLTHSRSAATTWLPVQACFDAAAKEVDVAIVWQSRR